MGNDTMQQQQQTQQMQQYKNRIQTHTAATKRILLASSEVKYEGYYTLGGRRRIE